MFSGAALAMLVWLARQLGSSPVRAAIAANGGKPRNSVIPIAVGICLALFLAAASIWIQRTDAAAKAVQEAKSKHGDSYRYYVSSLSYHGTGEGAAVSGVVTAWSNSEVKDVPFSWHE